MSVFTNFQKKPSYTFQFLNHRHRLMQIFVSEYHSKDTPSLGKYFWCAIAICFAISIILQDASDGALSPITVTGINVEHLINW